MNDLVGSNALNAHTERACDYLRQKILDGTYPAGYRLRTELIAKKTGVSRTPIREALRQLNSEGLVEIRPRLGASVRVIELQQFKEMCELRLALESFSAEQAARNRSPEDLVELEHEYQAMESHVATLQKKPTDPASFKGLVHQDISFHLSILKAAGNSLLQQEVLRLHLFYRLVTLNLAKHLKVKDALSTDSDEHRRWVLVCHRKILLAIKAQKPEQARLAMKEHISENIVRSVAALSRAQQKSSTEQALRANPVYTADY